MITQSQALSLQRSNQRVRKVNGYVYVGYIVAVFHTLKGEVRIVVENEASEGMLHIFNLDQFEEWN